MPNLDPFPDVTADEFGAIAAAESSTPLRGRPFPLAPVLVRILAIVFVPIGRLSGFVRGDVDEASANVVVDDEEDEDDPLLLVLVVESDGREGKNGGCGEEARVVVLCGSERGC